MTNALLLEWRAQRDYPSSISFRHALDPPGKPYDFPQGPELTAQPSKRENRQTNPEAEQPPRPDTRSVESSIKVVCWLPFNRQKWRMEAYVQLCREVWTRGQFQRRGRVRHIHI